MAKRLNGLEKVLRGFDDQPIVQTSLNGEPQGTINAKDLLTMVLGRGQSEDPIRAIDVGLKIHNAKNYIDLDDADVELLVRAVKADRGTTNLSKAFLLRTLDGVQPVEPKEK